ncbi:hypothetical protein CB0940_11498 [Lecanosticta acicola]|uniref:Globin-sensor domain-containing protein n=1 Tax=Lecanosticta acicola TaxID=111012 RepID=A0AAI8Z484_9PEZI|nr:hypothetical protein CB0940_11498 [Lecanosticta acicola]
MAATLPRGMEHIDRRELFTSLPARIHYLHEFLEFGPDDVEALVSGQKYIKLVIPAIVNLVYKKLLRHDITARVFSNRDSRSEENPEEWATENSNAIENRKMFLRWYLTKLNSDPTKMEYWEYMDKVGLMHVGQGRRNPLHVDYIFLGACLGYIQDALMEAILSHPKLHLQRKIAIVKAVGKVIWIQSDLLAKWHLKDGAEYSSDETSTALEEPEGYLHGKKVLGNNSDESSISGDDSSIHTSPSGKTSLGRDVDDVDMGEMRCPFSGLARGDQRAEMTRPAMKEMLDETRMHPVTPPTGKTVCKDMLEKDPWGKDVGQMFG